MISYRNRAKVSCHRERGWGNGTGEGRGREGEAKQPVGHSAWLMRCWPAQPNSEAPDEKASPPGQYPSPTASANSCFDDT